MYIIPQLRGEEKVEYVRKSRTDDPLLTVEETLAKHEQMLREWNENNQPDGGPIPESNIYREIGSGETISNRPRMRELLRRIESPKIKALLCVEPSRLTRGDLEDIGYLVKILRYTKTLVITLQGAYDLNDDGDRDRFERELMRGNDYLEYNKKVQWAGRVQSVMNGNFIGNTAPYGYRKIVIKEGKHRCHSLEPNPDTAPILRRIFEMYADGHSVGSIARQLDAEHVPAPKADRGWSPESLSGMLANVHYIGKVKWNARPTIRSIEDGEVIASRPRAEEYLVFEGKHPAIIDNELWERVQAIKGQHPRNKNATNVYNPLAGLLRCRECGRMMVGRKYLNKEGEERCAPRFHCNDRKGCQVASAKMDDVMSEVVQVLQSALDEFEVRVKAGTDDAATVHAQMVERMERRLTELREQEVQQWKEKMKNGMPEHVFKSLNEPLVQEIEDLEHAICEAKDSTPEPLRLDEKIVTLKSTLEALQDPEAPVKHKNRLLKACIEQITYYREKRGNASHPKRGDEAPIVMEFTLRI